MPRDELFVCFATLSWDFLWLRHQELMARFARAGNRVLFIEPIGIRMPQWQDRHRILARLQNRQRAGTRGIRPVMENVWVLDPIVNPFQQIGFAHRRNVRALTNQIQNAIQQVGGGDALSRKRFGFGTERDNASREPIVWTFVPTPLAREVIANLSPKLVIYDCMDALTENPKGVFSSFAESEKILSRDADIVFVTSPELLERQRALNPHTYYVPHGVAYEKFADVAPDEPRALKNIPHPRLAFFGGIDERVDIALLAQLAARHPAWQIVLLGIVRTDISALQKFPNVHFLGHIAHEALPNYLHHMDIFLLPYVQSNFSRYMNPAKLHECLAVGKPTVAIALPIFQEYRDVLSVASNANEYATLVERALAEKGNAEWIEKRRARARENTWERRFAEINSHIANRISQMANG